MEPKRKLKGLILHGRTNATTYCSRSERNPIPTQRTRNERNYEPIKNYQGAGNQARSPSRRIGPYQERKNRCQSGQKRAQKVNYLRKRYPEPTRNYPISPSRKRKRHCPIEQNCARTTNFRNERNREPIETNPCERNCALTKELPKFTKSITDVLYTEPTRLKPTTLAPDPKRAKLRTDNELPKCKKSRTEVAEPHLTKPTADTELPHRAKLRHGNRASEMRKIQHRCRRSATSKTAYR